MILLLIIIIDLIYTHYLHIDHNANYISPQLESQRNKTYRPIAALSKIKKTLKHNGGTVITQRGRVVSASDSQPGGRGFEFRSGDLFHLFSVVSSSNSRPRL